MLPTGPQLSEEGVEAMCGILRLALASGPELSRRLGSDEAQHA